MSTDTPPFRYTAALADQIETRWQQHWDDRGTFVMPNPGDPGFDASRPKFFCMDMFPYPSGAGLHVGHPEGYTATDIISRYKRMKGFNVLHPMGWDAFGLPAEQYAIQTGVHPAITTRKAIDTFRRQLKRFGFSYDWSREFATIDEDYYRWTQWIWLRAYNSWFDPELKQARPISELIDQLERGDARVGIDGELVHIGPSAAHMSVISGEPVGTAPWHSMSKQDQRRFIDDRRLAYLDEVTVNWCPKLGTVLANEEVIDGKSERGGFPVYRRPLKQWMFRITAYAARLLDDLAGLDWPESTKTMQTEWIGRSEGAEIDFELAHDAEEVPGLLDEIRVFTTRPDTIFGATYMVVAPEHPLVDQVLSVPPAGADVGTIRRYVEAARNRSDVERMADAKDKTGVFLGVHAINPASGARIPVWTADYVLMGYGHGAIMAVPAHDERDFDFAMKFNLPMRDVVYPRTLLAMRYFAEHSQAEGADSPGWFVVLADFLGLVASTSADPDRFAECLHVVRTRRATAGAGDQGAVCELDPERLKRETGSEIGSRRGSARVTWMDVIESLNFGSLANFRAVMLEGRYAQHTRAAYTGPGFGVNSANQEISLDGLASDEAMQEILGWLDASGAGHRRVNFKLRDWLFSRQRYWGEPFPIVYDAEGNHYPVSDAALPVKLPPLDDYTPPESDDPVPLLGKATAWINTTSEEAGVSPEVLPPRTPVRREVNTMPGWAGSCWYYLRYCDPKNQKRFVSREAERYWMTGRDSERATTKVGGVDAASAPGVDLYIGGAEHAVLHLLYARFWHKILFDLGEVSTPEPFIKLFHQGMITSYAYQRADKSLVPVDQVEEVSEGVYVEKKVNQPVTQVVAKMSKALKNVVNPDDMIAEFGADTFRLYEMYMGPLEASKPWNTRDIVGLQRFLQRLWRLAVDENTGHLRIAETATDAVERQLHKTIAKVEPDIEKLAFNTAIAALIEFVNVSTKAGEPGPEAKSGAEARGVLTRDQLERFAKVIAPFTPHIAEEIWHKLGHERSIAYEPWPAADLAMLAADTVEIPVQILGKVRSKVTVPANADEKMMESAALADEKIKALLEGKSVKKIIVVPGRLVNIVAN